MIKELRIGTASCGLAAGADDLLSIIKENFPEIKITEVGCLGHCYAEPLIEAITDNGSLYFPNVKADIETIKRVINEDKDITFDPAKTRANLETPIVTALAGRIDPIDIKDYYKNDGYIALTTALDKSPDEIIQEIKESGLRGRGGGGFPTAIKWSFLAKHQDQERIIICNADEGDPGAFMDRSLLESVPHQVLEGMLIGAYATGATTIIIYCRAEYPLAIKNLNIAIEQIYSEKINILHGKEIKITIKEGAGAFVCGEETALIHSLEGKRGMPRFRPPFPTDSGYMGLPSAINNVETFANVTIIMRDGADKYNSIGTEGSKGTKLFALAGDIKYPGLIEVPMGVTIRDIVCKLGGTDINDVKAIQIGGPSGGCLPTRLFDIKVDYDSLKEHGAIMGSGGLITIGKNRCMVETARYFLEFTSKESCGKCTFCRIGTTRMRETLERITEGNGKTEDISFLKDIGPKIIKGSLCGLGQTAPNPVLATLRYFEDDYVEHVEKKECSALICNALVEVYLDQEKCTECRRCIKTCPVNAISDDFVVNMDLCTRCNSCIEVCSDDAINRKIPGKTNV